MVRIKSESQYKMLLKKIDVLIDIVDDETPPTDPDYMELDLLTDLVEEYETEHYSIEPPSLNDVIKLRMYEMDITQAKLADLIGVSASRVSEYLSGKSEPTLQVAKNLHKKLNINPYIILQ
ncbi:helix-turn-helix domain-containing protein [Chryseobacterium sp. A321]